LLLQQCLAKLCAKAFLNGTCNAMIVSLVRKPTIAISKQYSYFPFFFEKGNTDRVPVKGNCVDSGQLTGRNFIVIAS